MANSAKLFEEMPVSLGGSNAAGGSPIDILSDTLKQMLSTSSWTPSQANHTVKGDVTNEVSSSNYTAGGAALANKTYSASSLVSTFDADDSAWTTVTFTTRYGAIYDDTIGTPVKPLLLYQDWGGDQSVSGNNFTITYNASGIFTVTVA